MAAPSSTRGLPLLIGLLAAILALGCAGAPTRNGDGEQKPATPPQTVAPASAIPPTPEAEDPVAAPVRSSNTIVIDEGGSDEHERSLAEVAEEEKERRRDAPPSVVVVTDKNLQEHATGRLTTSTGPTPSEEPPSEGTEEEREAYWRQRVRDHRKEWADAVDDILRLQQEVSELRLRFYAEDDPYVRDARIKPQWDRALDELGDARRRAQRLDDGLDDLLEEGRRSGAQPGWLREGSELEPKDHPYGEALKKSEDEAVVGEPVVIDENRRR